MLPVAPLKTNASHVLCVDLDGTLVRTDTFLETLFLFLRLHPLRIPALVIWLLRGRSYLKMRLAETALPIETLPYNTELLSYLRQRKSAGVKLVLATGADRLIASRVAGYLSLFDEVWSSDGSQNLVGKRKAQLLATKYPAFEYIGNSRTDLPVWLRSGGAILVSSSPKLRQLLERHSIPATSLPARPAPRISTWLRVLRVHQWVKNLLIFFPLLTAHRLTDWPTLGLAGIAFLAYSLAASGTYLINDLFDLQADRAHPGKCQRPFASGELTPAMGILAALPLFIAALATVSMLSPGTRFLLAGYILLTVSYSLWLKRLLVIDVLLLVCFYLSRIFFGGVATGISISVWLLAFSMFFFLALALVKRLTELRALDRTADGNGQPSDRGYHVSDVNLLGSLAASSAYLSVVLLALYINSPEAHLLYRQPQFLWPLCLVIIYWLTRIILIANRGQLHDDPIVFAAHDRASWITGVAVLTLLYVAH
jgi:4-hydroxybenzoate polyprenyltransferase